MAMLDRALVLRTEKPSGWVWDGMVEVALGELAVADTRLRWMELSGEWHRRL